VPKPKNLVTNEQFDTEYNQLKNQNVISFHIRKYGKSLTREEQKICGMIGLWKALSIFDVSRGFQLVTLLGKCVEIECKKLIKENGRFYRNTIVVPDIIQKNNYKKNIIEPIGIHTCFQYLTPKEQRILDLRINQQYTYDEIGKVFGISKQRIHQKFTKIKKTLREKFANSDGV